MTPTPRQREVGTLLATGRTQKEVAADLGLALNTVDNHRQELYRRIGVHSARELTIYAIKHGWIKTPKRPRGRPRKAA